MEEASARFDQVNAILEKYERRSENLIPILREIQDEYRYLPEDVMVYTARELKVPAATIYGVATFYAHFTLTPKGKYLIKVCDGTACHVKKSEGILNALEKELGITSKNPNTPDGLFTLETVACLGACGLAPVMVINEQVYGAMTPEKTIEVIRKIKEEEAAAND